MIWLGVTKHRVKYVADDAEPRALNVRHLDDFAAAKGNQNKFYRDEDENEQEVK